LDNDFCERRKYVGPAAQDHGALTILTSGNWDGTLERIHHELYVAARTKLNIEAYPNPAPVILEITAQAAGLSAEEMERYYTIPMEIGLYPTPGIDNIRSESFYGLTFVRVTFRYGLDYFFAYTQAALSLQQNVTLPGNQIPQIQQSSLVGEVYRYQIVGPPHFGLTNLRTVQDRIATRGLFTVTDGVVAVNSWGGTTKQYNVDVDLHKRDAYNVTVPQIISALGNANINVGGREITVGQQSVNIRGIGLFNSGGDDDLTQGWAGMLTTSRTSFSASSMAFPFRSRMSPRFRLATCRGLASPAWITTATSPCRSSSWVEPSTPTTSYPASRPRSTS
jgi:multidrug efflux pump subunit AcrB